jgi:aquaporin Z
VNGSKTAAAPAIVSSKQRREPATLGEALAVHWPEYLMEGAELGLFMISACLVTVLLEHPASPLHQALPDAFFRRVLMGLAMGLTAIGIVYSRWGQQSGAHFNPAFTLTFWWLNKIRRVDAIFYIGSQFLGGAAGVFVAWVLLGGKLSVAAVNFAATLPGSRGVRVAFVAEVAISFVVMLTVLVVSNRKALAHYTPLFVGALIALYITFEAPLSGMSMNPARTLASAVFTRNWTALWIYFTAPLMGMFLAAEVFQRLQVAAVHCAKLNHTTSKRCIFHCAFDQLN